MELGFLAVVDSRTFTEQEVRVKYFYTGGEEEWMVSTVVRYLIQQVLIRNYTLECTMQAQVSGTHMYTPSSHYIHL